MVQNAAMVQKAAPNSSVTTGGMIPFVWLAMLRH
jgi:hypothetical protein